MSDPVGAVVTPAVGEVRFLQTVERDDAGDGSLRVVEAWTAAWTGEEWVDVRELVTLWNQMPVGWR